MSHPLLPRPRRQWWARSRAIGLVILLGSAAVLVPEGAGRIDIVQPGREAGALDAPPAPEPSRPPAAGGPARLVPLDQISLACPVAGVDDPASTAELTLSAATAPSIVLIGLAEASGDASIEIGQPGAPEIGTTGTRGELLSGEVTPAALAWAHGRGPLALGIAAGLQRTATGENRGLAALACGATQQESWLIGGGPQPGRQERITIANPGANPVTVDLTILGADGQVDAARGRGLVIAPGEQSEVLLDALAPGVDSPAVQVSATGGRVVASMSDAWMTGSVPEGIELIAPSAPAGVRQILPAVPPGTDVVLRIANPGDAPAVVRTRALTDRGPVRIAKDVVEVPPRSALDVPVAGLPDQVVSLDVSSDVPIVAGAMTRHPAGAGRAVGEFSWSGASAPVTAFAGTVLPQVAGGEAEVVVVSPDSDATVRVSAVDATGREASHDLTLKKGVVTTLPAGQSRSVWIRTHAKGLYAGVWTRATDDQGILVAGIDLPEVPTARAALEAHALRN